MWSTNVNLSRGTRNGNKHAQSHNINSPLIYAFAAEKKVIKQIRPLAQQQ